MQELFMHQLYIDQAKLFRLGQLNHLSDNGYAVHSCLAEVFREDAPAPFAIVGSNGKLLEILAYSDQPKEELVENAKTYSMPLAYECIDWEAFHSKPMPLLAAGTVCDFSIRMCPVSRSSKEKKELDVFLSKVLSKESQQTDRMKVYCRWFSKLLKEKEAADCLDVRVEGFRLATLERRDSGRVLKRLKRPDVSFAGTLSVKDSKLFLEAIRKGLGRHKAFGFGMLLLKRSQKY